MTELDAELGPLAQELIAEFGKSVTYTRVTNAEPGYSTDTATVSQEPPDPKSVKAIIEDYNLQASGQAFASGLVQSGDKKITVAARDFEQPPTAGDRFAIDGVTYTVLNRKDTYTGDLIALHECQGRA